MEIPNSAPLHGSNLDEATLPPESPEGNLEVSIRTMASDFGALAEGGGAMISDESSLKMQLGGDSPAAPHAASSAAPQGEGASPLMAYFIWGFIFVVGTAILFFAGYYLVPKLIGAPDEKKSSSENRDNSLASLSSVSKNTSTPYLHKSFFKSPAEIIKVGMTGTINRTSFLELINKGALASPKEDFFEIETSNPRGEMMPLANLSATLGGGVLDSSLFEDHFLPDYTFFVEKIKGVLYPGYIFKLKDGQSPLLLQQKSLALESSPESFKNLFFKDPGTPKGAFTDMQVSGLPTRVLYFTSPSGNIFYGWFFNTYFILSTSEVGLKDAIVHF